ncbi:MAG: hypothetical protein ABIQ30_00295 [Devosia sp.]
MDDAPSATAHYDLYARTTEHRFVWRFKDHGVTVEDDSLSLVVGGQWLRIPFDRILSVTLSSNAIPRSGTIGQCTIQLVSGRRYVVGNGNDQGLADGRYDGPYRRFVDDLHKRLIANGAAGTIRFTSGYSEARRAFLIAALVVSIAFFVVLPLILLLIVRDLKILGVLAAGAAFVWPVMRVAGANRPGLYSPRNPPDFVE